MHPLLAKAKKELEALDHQREQVIAASREALREAKKAIYALHRGKADLEPARKALQKAQKMANHPRLRPLLYDAEEEFVEAACFESFPELPDMQSMGVDVETYLAGLCDCVGELTRKAINKVIDKDYDTIKNIHHFVTTIYEDLGLLDLRNGLVRKKFDSIKYRLERLESVLVGIELKQE